MQEVERFKAQRDTALAAGDYRHAYHIWQHLYTYTDSLISRIVSERMKIFAEQALDMSLRTKASQMEVQRMETQREQLERSRHLGRLEYQNRQEHLSQQRLQLRQQDNARQLKLKEQESQRLEYEKEVRSARMKDISTRLIAAVTVFIIILVVVFIVLLERSRKRLKRERAEADKVREQARQSMRVKEDFLRRMRTEVSEPLQTLSSSISSLQNKLDPGVRASHLSDLHHSARTIIAMFEEAVREAAPLLIAILLPATAAAQENPLHISDKAYAIFCRANRVLDRNVVTAMADTLSETGTGEERTQARLLAITLLARHAYFSDDDDELRRQIHRLDSASRGTRYEWMTYRCWNDLINFYIERDDAQAAMTELNQYQRNAVRSGNAYGMAQARGKSADIIHSCGMTRDALRIYNETLSMLKGNDPWKDVSLTLADIGRTQVTLGERQQGLANLRKSVETALLPEQKMPALNELFAFYTNTHNLDSAATYKRQLEAAFADMTLSPAVRRFYQHICARYWTDRGNFLHAYLYLDSIGTSYPITHVYVYSRLKQYDRACRWMERAYNANIERMRQTDNMRIGAFQAEMENVMMEEEYNRLMEHNLQLDVARLRSEDSIRQLQQQADSMQLRRGELEIADRKSRDAIDAAEKEREQIRQDDMMTQTRFRLRRNFIIIVAALAVLVFVLLLYFRRRQAQRRMKVAARRMDISRQQAIQADREKAEFISQMSHEVRTPINAILGFADMLYGPMADEFLPESEDTQQMQQTLTQNVSLLQQLVTEVTELCEWDDGHRQAHVRTTQVGEVVRQVLQKAHPAPGVEVTIDAPDGDIAIETDPDRLAEALRHLIGNACKFTSQGSIAVTYRHISGQGDVAIAITNTHEPIPPERANFIFRRFAKLDSFQQGLGLGLSLCKVIVAALRGNIRLDTYYTDGVRFIIELPPGEAPA